MQQAVQESGGLRVVCTAQDVTQAEIRAKCTLVKPEINTALPPKLVLAAVRGVAARSHAQGCFLDLRGKKVEWLQSLHHLLQTDIKPVAGFLICLQTDLSPDLLQDYDWLEPLLNKMPQLEGQSGFAIWRGDESDAEDVLARLLWREYDYLNRWQRNRGRTFYYPRAQLEQELGRALQEYQPLLITGMALAGKTRLLLRTLFERKEALLVALPDCRQFSFPANWPKELWVVFDDLDLLLQNEDFRLAFQAFAKEHRRWLATCRSGEAYDSICAALDSRQREYLHSILIGRLNAHEVQQVAVQLHLGHLPQQRQLPQNIGYYFLQDSLKIWREIYAQLPTPQVKALRAGALCMRFGATEDLENMNLEIPRRCAGQGLPEFLDETGFNTACQALHESEQGRGWWRYDPLNQQVRLEPVFVDHIIDPNGALLALNYLPRLQSALPNQTWLAQPLTIERWANQVLRHGLRLNAENKQLLQQTLQILQREAGTASLPARAALRALILLYFSASDELQGELLAMLPVSGEDKGLQISLNQLLAEFPTLSLSAVLALFERLEIGPNAYTFNTLLAHSSAGGEGDALRQQVLAQMQARGIALNVVTYTTLLEKASNQQERERILMQMVKDGIVPNAFTYNILLEKAANQQERERLLMQMQIDGLAPNVVTYNTLLEKASNQQERALLLTQMQKDGIAPDAFTYNTLLEKASNQQERALLLTQMQKDGIAPNVVTYNTLLEKTANQQERERLLTQMRADGIAPNVITYTTLLEKAANQQERALLLAQMQKDGILPDVITYTTLLEKAANQQEREHLLAQMQKDGILPDVITYNTLLKHAKNYVDCLQLRAAMERSGIQANLATFNTLISHCENFTQAQGLFRELLVARWQPNSYTIQAMVKKSPDFAHAKRIVEECAWQGAKLNEHVLRAWRFKAKTTEEHAEISRWELSSPFSL